MKKDRILSLIFLSVTIVAAMLIFRKKDDYAYFISLTLLISGLIRYPANYNKFIDKKDFMVFPLLVAVVFNIINLFYLKNYTGKMALVNTLMGLYGFLQCLYYKNKTR